MGCILSTAVGIVDDMTMQIAVRLPDEMVEFLDRLVAEGQAPSRAAVVEQALGQGDPPADRGQGRRDPAATGPDRDLGGLVDYAAGTPMGLG